MDSAIRNNQKTFYTLAIFFFVVSVYFAVLIDLPLALENLVAGQKPTRHLSDEFFQTYQIPWEKLGKDIFFLLALFFSVIVLYARLKACWSDDRPLTIDTYLFFFLILIIAILAFRSLIQYGIWYAAVGLRANLALSTWIFGVIINRDALLKIWRWITPLAIFQAFIAILQTTITSTDPGIRAVGTFFSPSTLGLFAVVFLLLTLNVNIKLWLRLLYGSIAILIVLLSRSRLAIGLTLILIYFYLWLYILPKRFRWLMFALIPLMVIVGPYLLEVLSGRSDVFHNLFAEGVRLNSTWKYATNADFKKFLIGQGLGRGTALSWMTKEVSTLRPAEGFDQQIGSSFVQGGIVLLIALIIFLMSPLLRLLRCRYNFLSLALPVVTLGAMTATTVFEAWPANILLMMLYGYISEFEPTLTVDSTQERLQR
jgi:hypothetical protein